ncbi:hypothetical protein Q1695_003716 [Nippostrongylus brasiliensis]|nr:hypothetical protein Q1695_003716 [Nippostrongylus brasiliensis]
MSWTIWDSSDDTLVSHASFMCTLYVYLGLTGTVITSLNMALVLSSSELRKRWILTIVFNFGELFNEVSYILVGLGRRQEIDAGTLFDETTVRNCFLTKYWPHALILGTELPAFHVMLASFVRIAITTCPGSHERIQRLSFCHMLFTPFLACTISLLAASASVYQDGGRRVETQHCFIIDSTAVWFSTFHFVVGVLGFVLCFLSFVIYWLVQKWLTQNVTMVSYQPRILPRLLASGLSAILMAMPATVMLFMSLALMDFDDVTVAVTYAMPGVASIIHTLLNFFFQEDLRRQFITLCGFEWVNISCPINHPAIKIVILLQIRSEEY